MYGYSSADAGTGFGSFGIFFFLLMVAYIVSWVLTMGIVTMAAKEKGYDNLGGKLWFIGLFGLVFTPAIIVSALPDKTVRSISEQHASKDNTADDELPDL